MLSNRSRRVCCGRRLRRVASPNLDMHVCRRPRAAAHKQAGTFPRLRLGHVSRKVRGEARIVDKVRDGAAADGSAMRRSRRHRQPR
eukprot:1264948-Pleurochrysis_carterae.AAC.1